LGGSRYSGIVLGPLLIVWVVRYLVSYLRDSLALFGDQPRAIRPDELAPMQRLRTRMTLTTMVCVVAIAFGCFMFWDSLVAARS